MQKQCQNPRCGKSFETDWVSKAYCTVKCRRTAKEIRAVARDPVSANGQYQSGAIHNPSMMQLAALAIVYAANANPTPTLLTGMLPEGYILPDNVEIVPQVKLNETDLDSWLMQTKVKNLMEEFQHASV